MRPDRAGRVDDLDASDDLDVAAGVAAAWMGGRRRATTDLRVGRSGSSCVAPVSPSRPLRGRSDRSQPGMWSASSVRTRAATTCTGRSIRSTVSAPGVPRLLIVRVGLSRSAAARYRGETTGEPWSARSAARVAAKASTTVASNSLPAHRPTRRSLRTVPSRRDAYTASTTAVAHSDTLGHRLASRDV